jgi:hypothetical protein
VRIGSMMRKIAVKKPGRTRDILAVVGRLDGRNYQRSTTDQFVQLSVLRLDCLDRYIIMTTPVVLVTGASRGVYIRRNR